MTIKYRGIYKENTERKAVITAKGYELKALYKMVEIFDDLGFSFIVEDDTVTIFIKDKAEYYKVKSLYDRNKVICRWLTDIAEQAEQVEQAEDGIFVEEQKKVTITYESIENCRFYKQVVIEDLADLDSEIIKLEHQGFTVICTDFQLSLDMFTNDDIFTVYYKDEQLEYESDITAGRMRTELVYEAIALKMEGFLMLTEKTIVKSVSRILEISYATARALFKCDIDHIIEESDRTIKFLD